MLARWFARRPRRQHGVEKADSGKVDVNLASSASSSCDPEPSEGDRLVRNEEVDENDEEISFIVDYVGSDYVSEAQSLPLLMETLKRIKKQQTHTTRVDFVLRRGILKVSNIEQGALLITAPLYAIALCAQEQLRGFEATFALNITRRRIHMCHVFQGGSRLEASSIVRAVALSFKSVGKVLKERRAESTAVDRLRSDSEGSRHRACCDPDDHRDVDGKRVLATRSGVVAVTLPTLPSEESLVVESSDGSSKLQRGLGTWALQRLDLPAGDFRDEGVCLPSSDLKSSEKDHVQASGKSCPVLHDKDKDFVTFGDDVKIDTMHPGTGFFQQALDAIIKHDVKLLEKCIEEGLCVDAEDGSQRSLLHYAVLHNKVDVVEFLLDRGADANWEDEKDQTPLHCAAAQGNRAVAKLLLAYGANVRAKDRQFRTPLHLCAGCLQSLEVSYVLVEHGARIEDNDLEGTRPVDLHLELREMQNRLIQSASEAFAAASLSRSRSNSGSSSRSGSVKSNLGSRSPVVARCGGKVLCSSSFRMKASLSLQSIPDSFEGPTSSDLESSDNSSSLSPPDIVSAFPVSKLASPIKPVIVSGHRPMLQPDEADVAKQHVSSDAEDSSASDQMFGAYSDSARDGSGTDSDLEARQKDLLFVHDDFVYGADSDEESLRHMRELIDQKASSYPASKSNSVSSYDRVFKRDPLTDALHLLVTLSANVECQASILANVCLPKASGQLVNLAHSVDCSPENLLQISRLLSNLFSVCGPSGGQKCVQAGLLKTVIDLLDAPEPIQGSCLSILNDLLQTENEREDYSAGSISGIPVEPLLALIVTPRAGSDADSSHSGSGKLKVKPTRSCDSGYPGSPLVERSGSLSRKKGALEIDREIEPPLRSHTWSRNKGMHAGDSMGRVSRADTHDSSRDSSPISLGRVPGGNEKSMEAPAVGHGGSRVRNFSKCNATMAEIAPNQTSVVARHVAMKMLAASSRNPKLQEQLAKPRILHILLDCLDDADDEIVLQATATLANVAMNFETHLQLQLENIVEGLFKLIRHCNLRIQYQAARGLIYLGHEVEGIYIYDLLPDEDCSPTVIYHEETDRTYIRGTTVENLVLILTSNLGLLWGGTSLAPPSPNDAKQTNRRGSMPGKPRGKPVPSEHQIINFVLATYPTFIHPVILMRLLLHRFRNPAAYQVFASMKNSSAVQPHMEHYAPLPVLHARLMRVWITWLEIYPEDFRCNPLLVTELQELINPMKGVGGPYVPCAERLEGLFAKAKDALLNGSLNRFETESHHNVLYEQCFRAITTGQLPCSEDDFVYLCGLQLYIEDLREYGPDFATRLNTLEGITSTRLKHSINAACASSKAITKRIRSHYEQFLAEQPSDRNAKHNYVDCCQGMEGYACKFFRLKQRIPPRKKVFISRLVGVSCKRIVVLDERTKICVEKFHSKDLRRWEPAEDNLTLKMIFKSKTVEFQVENRIMFKELSSYILQCSMELSYNGYGNIDTSPWSKLAEEVGTWGNMALQVHLQDVHNESDDSPPGERCVLRERATTVAPDSSRSPTGKWSFQRPLTAEVSRSAPARPELGEWNPLEGLSYLSLRGKPRCRGDTVISVSGSNSETGTPPKDLAVSDGAASTSTTIEAVKVPVDVGRGPHSRGRSPSSALASPMPTIAEWTPMLSDGDKSCDPSQTECPKYGVGGKILSCHCPPDADLPNLNLREFSAFELLQHPKELARQITLIDHEFFRAITSRDVLHKISLGVISKHKTGPESQATVDKLAQRFNQMSNWIVFSIVSERHISRRAQMFINFIETAKQCLELRNYNAVMAIVVAALGSAPIRRLAGTKELIPSEVLSCFNKMENLMDSKGNHKKYRETLRTSPTPAVPFFGLYLKDLTFISDGNPDYLKGGLINLNKRRQVCVLLDEIHRFQKKRYNFQEVAEIRDYLLKKPSIPEEQLHKMSKEAEPAISSRLGSATPPVTHHNPDKRGNIPAALFRHHVAGNRMAGRRNVPSTRTTHPSTPV